MAEELAPAIAALERLLAASEKKSVSLRAAINTLCEEAGQPPRYPDAAASGDATAGFSQIQSDTFYGKRQSTAIRVYLEMRKAQGQGPATPREIFEALKAGGYQFETKDETVALIGLRALLRKNSVTFHKLPNGSYGLLTWYPDAKAGKADEKEEKAGKADEKEEEEEKETAAPEKLRRL